MATAAAPALTLIEFDLPPKARNAEGRMRTVGVEIEFTGMTAKQAANALRSDS